MKLLLPPPVQLIFAGIIMGLISKFFSQLNFVFSYQNIFSIGMIVTGLTIELSALIAFLRAKTTVNPMKPDQASKLIVSGLYRLSRNPMYLGMAFLLAGWRLYLGNPINLILWGSFVVSITYFQIKPEEEILLKKFGTDYADYCSRVRRWI